MAFDHFSFGALSLFSLSHTLGHLYFYWTISALDQERQEGKEEANIKKGGSRSSIYNAFTCRYQFSCLISLLDLACMVMYVCSWFSFFH